MVSMVSTHKERGFKSQLELIENIVQIATEVCGVMIIGSMKKDIWCNEAKKAVDEEKLHIRGRLLQKNEDNKQRHKYILQFQKHCLRE